MICRRIHHSTLLVGLAVVCWLFIGILQTFEETSIKNEIFLKKIPTFQLIFRDPYESTPKDEEHVYASRINRDGFWMPGTEEFRDFYQYCKYRYGVLDAARLQSTRRCQ